MCLNSVQWMEGRCLMVGIFPFTVAAGFATLTHMYIITLCCLLVDAHPRNMGRALLNPVIYVSDSLLQGGVGGGFRNPKHQIVLCSTSASHPMFCSVAVRHVQRHIRCRLLKVLCIIFLSRISDQQRFWQSGARQGPKKRALAADICNLMRGNTTLLLLLK